MYFACHGTYMLHCFLLVHNNIMELSEVKPPYDLILVNSIDPNVLKFSLYFVGLVNQRSV